MSNEFILREAKKEDLFALWQMCSVYFSDVRGSSYEDFAELWNHRWFGSPFKDVKDPLGWVLEDSAGKVKGFIGNIPLMMRSGKDLIKTYAATTWVAEPEARNSSIDLFRAFVRYDKKAFLLDTTANKTASLVCKRLGMKSIEAKNYKRRLIWIVNPVSFLREKRCFSSNNYIISLLLMPFLYFGAFILKCYLIMRGQYVKVKKNPMQFIQIETFGPEFDLFWDDIKMDLGIVGERTSKFMNWRCLDLPRLKGRAFSFMCKDQNGSILGYIAVKSNGLGEGGEKRFAIIDILFKDKQYDVFLFMIVKVYEFVKKQGAAMLECFGFNESLMDKLMIFKPFVKWCGHNTYWYKFPEKIHAVDSFWISGIDGDLNL